MGIDQADRYQVELDTAITRLKQFPELGHVAMDDVRELVLRHHVILYQYRADVVMVLRVLNPRQLRR